MKNHRLWIASITLALAAFVGLQATGNPQGTGQAPAQALRQFSGTPIDVDYQSANLRTVLRNLSEIGGINLVIDPSVPGNATVDLKLSQVPWDQVMDVVMKSSQLTYDLQGPVLRVLTRDARTKELQAEADQKRAGAQAPDLVMRRVRLNYASAADVQKLLLQGKFVSDRGTVEIDARTNMLIIQDVAKNLSDIDSLVGELDKPEPQVEIEAKIIQANRDTAKALGVQWGVNGRVAPELGNTTALGFPNRGTAGGRVNGTQGAQTQGPNDPRSGDLEKTGTAVNLPVVGATSALGISMGSVNGAFNIDVAITALEHQGKLTILSTPRVMTQNNKVAEVTQGFQIPFQTIANNTVTTQFRDAALKLRVTPQITAANTVIMTIELENAQPDFSRAVLGNPSIATQRAITQVQVSDGSTTVIGGILQQTDTQLNDQTPGLHKIPLLGWLFKRTDTKNEQNELMISLTPRIIR